MAFSSNRVLSLSATLAVLTLAACDTPNMFPDGYVHYNEPYKSATPAESSKFTKEQRATMGPEQADQFRLATYQLAENLTRRAGMPPKSVFVMKPKPMTPFYANMDNDLRESLRHLGYTLADTPDNAYVFTYSAEVLGKTPTNGAPNVRLGLQVFDGLGAGSKMLTVEEGDFYIQGAETLNVPFASFPGTVIPEPTGPGTFRE